jgi:sarcosine oxidase subunit alpha
MNSHGASRIAGQDGAAIEFLFDSQPVTAAESDTVASALFAAGQRVLTIASDGSPRGGFCFIGRCSDCLMVIDGQPGTMACQTPVRQGMRVETQRGRGHWPGEAAP